MSRYPEQCSIKYALERDKVISESLKCISASSLLETLCKQFSTTSDQFEVQIQLMSIDALIPTQDSIEKWKYMEVSKKTTWGGPENKFFKKGDRVDYCEEPVLVLYCHEESRSAAYLIAGHARARRRREMGHEQIRAIVIKTYKENIQEAYELCVSRLKERFGPRPTVMSLPLIKGNS